jgi:hypothetical protein
MTQITARGWPGLVNYKPPEGGKAKGPTSLRSYDLWLVPYFKDGRGAVIAMSGSVELARIDLPDEKAIRDWCDPQATIKTQPYGLWRAYQPNVAIVGWDLGYTFGQIAEYWQPTRDKAYRIFPYGWGKPSKSGRTYGATSPHRPPLMMRPRQKGWQVWWGKPRSGPPGRYGKWVDGKLFTGNFIDLQSVEFALGLHDPAPGEFPPIEEAAYLAEVAIALDNRAQRWFGGTLDTRTLSSPATLAKGLLQRVGVAAPLSHFQSHDLSAWTEHLSGGWLSADAAYIGKPTPVVPLDLSAAYALSWCLTDCWSVLTADHLDQYDYTETFRYGLTELDPALWALEPWNWRDFGCTLVQVQPDGEPWPVELGNLQRAYVPLTSKQPMWFPWQTVVAAAVLSGKTPKVLRATKLVPVGKQHLHNVEVLPGLKIRAHDDPVPALVKARKDHPQLKWLIECLVWGIECEFRQLSKTVERPAPWCFPPIAATVAAGPRLLLALLDRMVRDAGGAVVYRDTDSSFMTGCYFLEELAQNLTAQFAALDQGWGVWRTGRECNILVRDVKKYILFDNEGNLLDWKESNLRGTYEDPPGHPDWTKDYHERVVRREVGLPVTGPVPTYLRQGASRLLQGKPGAPAPSGRPGAYYQEYSFDSYLTRLRMWHRDKENTSPTSINVTSIRYKGSASDAIKANREGRDLERLDYGRTCPGCGDLLQGKRRQALYCSPRCKQRVYYARVVKSRQEEAS